MAADNSPFTILLLGRKGMGKSTTGNILLNAVTKDNPDGNRRIRRVWPQEEVGSLSFATDWNADSVTRHCELLVSTTGKADEVWVLDTEGFAGSDVTDDAHKFNCKVARQIADVFSVHELAFDRVLYFLPGRGTPERADGAWQDEIAVMWSFFGKGILFENMVLVATMPEYIPINFAPRKYQVERAFSAVMKLALEHLGVSETPPCPPVLFIPFGTDSSTLLTSIKEVRVRGGRALKLTFHRYTCCKCADLLSYVGATLVEVKSGAKFCDPNNSRCHPVFIPKYSKLAKLAGGIAHVSTLGFARVHELRTGQQILPSINNSDEVCANCEKAPGSIGCMRVMEDKYEGQYVQHSTRLAERDLVSGGSLKVKEQIKSQHGFTESECHALYQKAITDNPTITLHIAKAMTIGPPRVGKTSLRHLLLGLPLPEVSISTPVMKTAETVGILSSDETPSSDEYKVSGAVKADSDLIQIGSEDKWVLVNETSAIRSLLSRLEESVVKTEHAERTQEAGMKDSHSALSTHGDLIWPHPQSHFTKSHPKHATIEPEGKVKRHITSTSTGDTAKDSSQVPATVSQLYRMMQTPNNANTPLPDAKLVQFLDCGGQLAYHDILPIFTTIPAIYLHVFDLTKELDSCPEDQLRLDTAREMYSARSPLTVAEMMTRSVMTISSLADKRVQLPKEVLLCDPPKPHVAFVGTHLDEPAKESKDMETAFDSTSKALQTALGSESHGVGEMVLKNLDPGLPANFFPVTNKHKMRSDVSDHAITRLKGKFKSLVSQGVNELSRKVSLIATKQLKGRIQALVSGVKVKVPVKWYFYQMLEIGLSKEKRAPVHKYSDLYKSCHLKEVVNDLMEFHTMITYFHSLGLLIHACNDDAHMHREDSTCLVFTDPSYLFENISKLFYVHFLEPIRCSGSLQKLKLEGKLTEKTLKDLKVDSTQLDYKSFMDVLVHFFIGADIEIGAGNEDRTLFIPSVLPVNDISQPLPTEQSLHFVIAFNEKPFIPCGVYAGVIARLLSLPKSRWEISPDSVSRSHAAFGVAATDRIELFNCSSHIRVELGARDREKAQEYRDTVLAAVSESYCFLFHAKPATGQPCSTCRDEPYLVLGMTCQHCRGAKTNHIAILKVDNGEAKAVRCRATQHAREIHGEHQELFRSIQRDAVVREQHTSRPTFSRKVMTLPPQDTAEHTTEEAVLHRFKSFGDRFVKDVHSRDNPAFTVKLYRQKVIPESLKNQILAAADGETANELLFEHLSKQATCESLSKLLTAMIEAEGHPAMTKLGREMKRTLGL